LPSCQRRSAEVEEVLHGHLSPAGFWRREFAPSPGNKRAFSLAQFEIFHSFPFSKGEKAEGILHRIPQSSPPFEKGRTGGMSGKAFSKR
jgi:hypothetical protein